MVDLHKILRVLQDQIFFAGPAKGGKGDCCNSIKSYCQSTFLIHQLCHIISCCVMQVQDSDGKAAYYYAEVRGYSVAIGMQAVVS